MRLFPVRAGGGRSCHTEVVAALALPPATRPVARHRRRPGRAPGGLDLGAQSRHDAGEAGPCRPWHLVDAGSWQPEAATLTVTWTDGARPGQWTFRDQHPLLPETVRERVQASVVLSTRLVLGERRTGRVAIRPDLATRELIPQTVLARSVRPDDTGVREQVEAAMADLQRPGGPASPLSDAGARGPVLGGAAGARRGARSRGRGHPNMPFPAPPGTGFLGAQILCYSCARRRLPCHSIGRAADC